ncbi:MAG: hypothetical protein Q9204_006853 [Flavoplaca sp. TL-2023a]
MSTTTTIETISKPNVGVFTNPEHKLWVEESKPNLDSLKQGKSEDLPEGYVTVAIKSTDPTSTSGAPAPSAPWSSQTTTSSATNRPASSSQPTPPSPTSPPATA